MHMCIEIWTVVGYCFYYIMYLCIWVWGGGCKGECGECMYICVCMYVHISNIHTYDNCMVNLLEINIIYNIMCHI